jgi:hypothetical protein
VRSVSSLRPLRCLTKPSVATKPLIGVGNPLLNGPDQRYAQLAMVANEMQQPRHLLHPHFATHGVLAGQLTPGAEPGLILTPPNVPSDMKRFAAPCLP